jgi:hypothetical protein
MVAETRATAADVLANGGDLAAMLTADHTFVDGPLAALYGMSLAANAPLTRVPADAHRLGVLDQAAFLTTYARSAGKSSPTRRGKAVRTRLLCGTVALPDPSLKVNMNLPDAPAANTTRDVFIQHTTNPACSVCHKQMDLVGFGFEHFDGTGAYRETENGHPIDDSGELVGADTAGTFTDGHALIQKLATSADVASCHSLQFFHSAAAQTEPETDSAFQAFLQTVPAHARTRLPELLTAFVQSSLFAQRSVP